MGRSAKLREQRREEIRAQKEALKAREQKLGKWRKVRPFIIAAVSVLAAACIGLGVFFGIVVKTPTYLRNTVMLETENYTVTGQMMAYYIYTTYETYYQQYGTSLNISADTPLKKQMFREDASWFDYFNAEAQVNMQQVLLFAEKAKEQGITLTEEEQKQLDESVALADISTYQKAFGMQAEDLKQALELTALASKMYQKAVEDMAISDQDVQKYFEENEKRFKAIDYTLISIPYGKNGWYEKASGAKSAAELLQKATSVEMFESYVSQLLQTIGASADEAKNELEKGKVSGAYYTQKAFYDWAFAAGRKVGDIYVEDNGSAYDVYQLTALPVLPESDFRNVRHILLSEKTCETIDKAKDKAESLLAEWKSGDATAETFAALAKENTEDEGSKENGGLYENVSQGEMIEQFDKWLFDDARKEGDAEIVKTDYGYHIMYYAGAGQEAWQVNAKSALINKNTSELCAKYIETWPITAHQARIKRLPL